MNLKSIFRRLFTRSESSRPAARTRLGLDTLESREVPAGLTLTRTTLFTNGSLLSNPAPAAIASTLTRPTTPVASSVNTGVIAAAKTAFNQTETGRIVNQQNQAALNSLTNRTLLTPFTGLDATRPRSEVEAYHVPAFNAIVVLGSSRADTIAVRSVGSEPVSITANGRTVGIRTKYSERASTLQLFQSPTTPTVQFGTRPVDSFPRSGIGTIYVLGGEGGDRISAAGTDLATDMDGQGGDDAIVGGSYLDTIRGGIGNDTISGGGGKDTLFGDAGNDKLHGDGGNDTLSGGEGDDLLVGGADHDTLDGDGGNDELRGDVPESVLYGPFVGNDTLRGGQGSDRLFGDGGNDTLYGGTENDQLFGGDGVDRLYGEAGNDGLFGGTGWNEADVIDGGTGNDRVYRARKITPTFASDFAETVTPDASDTVVELSDTRFDVRSAPDFRYLLRDANGVRRGEGSATGGNVSGAGWSDRDIHMLDTALKAIADTAPNALRALTRRLSQYQEGSVFRLYRFGNVPNLTTADVVVQRYWKNDLKISGVYTTMEVGRGLGEAAFAAGQAALNDTVARLFAEVAFDRWVGANLYTPMGWTSVAGWSYNPTTGQAAWSNPASKPPGGVTNYRDDFVSSAVQYFKWVNGRLPAAEANGMASRFNFIKQMLTF